MRHNAEACSNEPSERNELDDQQNPNEAADGRPALTAVSERGKRVRPLTPAMLAMLRSASAGLPLKTGLQGRAAHGGAEWTIVALRKRGYLKGNEITAAGLAVTLVP